MGFMDTLQKESSYSTASGNSYQYVVLQVTLKEKFIGTGSGNLTELENAINEQAAKGYRLHTITTANGGSKGLMGGDRIQATMVFEKVVQTKTPAHAGTWTGSNKKLPQCANAKHGACGSAAGGEGH